MAAGIERRERDDDVGLDRMFTASSSPSRCRAWCTHEPSQMASGREK